MIRIMFVCHGNICRSPMAEFVLKDIVKKKGRERDFIIESAAAHTDALGANIHRGTREKLIEKGIPFDRRKAMLLTKSDYREYDYFIGMDKYNVADISLILGADGNICRLLDFTDNPRDVADPWYTGDFESCYRDIREGLEALLDAIL